jgi:hypothetical protein
LDGVANTGAYEARAFFENNYRTKASTAFNVGEGDGNFGKKGDHGIAAIELPNKTFVHHPTDLNGESAYVVLVSQGGSATYAQNKYITLMNFIASHGYYAIYTDMPKWNTSPKDVVEKFNDAITALEDRGLNVNTSKIGVFGLSSGGGRAFGILHEIKKTYHYGQNESFIFSIDPFYALGMWQQDLINLSDNHTNMVILQNGIKGNTTPNDFGDSDYTTDALFPLTIYRLIKQNNPLKTDYQVFEGAGYRGHLYMQDHSVEDGVVGQNYEQMEGALTPFGALMELTFKGNESARNIALNSGSDTPVSDGIQEVKPKAYYHYKCTQLKDVDYCADDNNRDNIPDL